MTLYLDSHRERNAPLMKILLISPLPHEQLFELTSCLQDLNHEVLFKGTQDYEEQYTYIEKKMYKLGMTGLKETYYKKLNRRMRNAYLQFNPDLVLITNGSGLDPQLLKEMKQKTKIILWLFDSVKREFIAKTYQNFPCYDKVFVFEKNDIPFLKEKYGIEAEYCPIGYNHKKYYPLAEKANIDISFVGNPAENRISILREVVKYVHAHHLTMKIYGSWYNEQHFWKKFQFKKREPLLFKYTVNKQLPPQEVADLYRHSKICLNIHIDLHKGINPRTFEILGAKAFELMDQREDYYQLIRPGIDVAVYESTSDLIRKIDYYLAHEKERNEISAQGYEWVKNKLTMTNCLNAILKSL